MGYKYMVVANMPTPDYPGANFGTFEREIRYHGRWLLMAAFHTLLARRKGAFYVALEVR